MGPTVKFKKLHSGAIIPAYQTAGAAGMDLHWCGRWGQSPREWATLTALSPEPTVFWTGLSLELPEGYEAQIRPRSGLSKRGLLCHFGTIDRDYRGNLGVCLQYLGEESFSISRGDRIAQLVIAPVARCVIQVAEELTPTERGGGGFGSTGR